MNGQVFSKTSVLETPSFMTLGFNKKKEIIVSKTSKIRRQITPAIIGLWCMACGGLLLHARIHPVSKDAFNWFAHSFLLFNTLILPWMFLSRRTMPWAYIINATSVVVGVVTMTWFSIAHWSGPLTISALLLNSTLADCLIVLAKLPLAHSILLAWRRHDQGGTA